MKKQDFLSIGASAVTSDYDNLDVTVDEMSSGSSPFGHPSPLSRRESMSKHRGRMHSFEGGINGGHDRASFSSVVGGGELFSDETWRGVPLLQLC